MQRDKPRNGIAQVMAVIYVYNDSGVHRSENLENDKPVNFDSTYQVVISSLPGQGTFPGSSARTSH